MITPMCGRFTMTHEQLELLADDLGVAVDTLPNIRPRYNIAPTDEHFIVRMKHEDREVLPAKWGLVNSWAKDAKRAAMQINARAETIEQRSGYRDAFERRRCIVPADGFIEWTGPKTARQPLWFHAPDASLIYFAGLYESWSPKPGEWQRTFTIITTGANSLLAPIHDRMPVILAKSDIDDWLAPNVPLARVRELLVPAPFDTLVARRVSPKINSVRYDAPDALDELQPELGASIL
jgi:putative SOS response-associated peptidase YedK